MSGGCPKVEHVNHLTAFPPGIFLPGMGRDESPEEGVGGGIHKKEGPGGLPRGQKTENG